MSPGEMPRWRRSAAVAVAEIARLLGAVGLQHQVELEARHRLDYQASGVGRWAWA